MQHRLRLGLFLLSTIAIAACSSDWQAESEPVDTQQWHVHSVCGKGEVVGIDVSSWQSTVDWAKVKAAGKQFAIARVTHGTGTIDSQFAANWKGMKANGIIRGAYQFFEPSQGGLEQAKLFVAKIEEAGGFEDGDLPGVIDVESVDGATSAQTIAEVHNWIDYVESQTNRKPIIYAGSYFWDDHNLGNDFGDYPLWGPHYTTSDCHLISDAWDTWTFWQHTDSGSVAGISGNVDLDRFNGNLADLQAFIKGSIINPPPGPEPEPEPQPEAGPEPEEASVEGSSPEAQPKDSAVASDSTTGDEQTVPPADAGGLDGAKGVWQSQPEDEGCGCRTAGRKTNGSAAGLALLLGALLASRRKSSRAA